MPDNIILFERFCYASVALGLLYLGLDLPGALQEVEATAGQAGRNIFLGITVILSTIFIAINILLIWLTARRSNNVARWVFAIFVVLGLLVFVFQIGEMSANNLVAALVFALATMLEVIGIVLIFTGDARDHFA